MKREIKTTLALDGEKEYKKALSDAARQLRVLDSELKATSSSFGDNTESVEALTAKSKILRKEVDKQEEMVNTLRKAVEAAADKYGEADSRTDGYRIRLNKAIVTLNNMNHELDENERKLSDTERALEDASREVQDFGEDIDDTTGSIEDAGDGMGDAFGGLSGLIGGEAGEIISSISGIGDKIRSVASETDSSAGTMGLSWGGVATAALAVVAAVAKIGVEAYQQARDVRLAAAEMKVALGLTQEETEALRDTAESLYIDGYAESMEDAMAALTITKAYMGDLNNEDLGKITGQAKVLSEVFHVDMQSMIKTASTMMMTFGDDAETTMDTITALMQTNPSEGGEFLDSLNEYSTQFEQMGYSAQEFAGILAAGMDSGAFSIDKIGDAYKELNIRAKDGSDSTKEAIMALGLAYGDFETEVNVLKAKQTEYNNEVDVAAEKYDKVQEKIAGFTDRTKESVRAQAEQDLAEYAQDLAKAEQNLQSVNDRLDEITGLTNDSTISVEDFMRIIAEGGPGAQDAINQIFTALSEMEDSLKQNELGVALMGSQWEDVGGKILTSLSSASTELQNTAGLAQQSAGEILDVSLTDIDKINRRWGIAFQEYIEGAWENFKEYLYGGLTDPALDTDAYNEGEGIGTSVGDGMADGIDSQEEKVRTSASRLAQAAAEAANAELDINSPSKVFAQIGAYSAQGLGVGFTDEMRSIERQVQGAMAGLVPSEASARIISSSERTVNHKGTIRVEGVNNKDELISIIKMDIIDEMQMEMRAI